MSETVTLSEPKKTYERPALRKIGSVLELTQGLKAKNGDAGGMGLKNS